MDKNELEKERSDLQAILDDYERGFKHFGQGATGNLGRDTTAERIASIKRRIAWLDEEIGRAGKD